MLHEEFQYFIVHQDELVREYGGRVLVIQHQQVIGVYDSPLQAYVEAQKTHELGSFLIQACEPGEDAYTVRSNRF